jgi:CO dehydrogenase nickel-insertion accessory protein CooC1
LGSPDLIEMANKTFREARIKGILFVLNKVEDQATESYLREQLGEKGIRPIGVIHRDRGISLSWLKGMPLDVTKTARDVEEIIEKLEAVAEASTEVRS